MSNKIPQEEWTPLPFMEGEHALSKIEYNATERACPSISAEKQKPRRGGVF